MRRFTLVPLALAFATASCSMSDIEDGLDAVFGNTSKPDHDRPGQPLPIAQTVRQKNLVSDLPDVAAKQDPNLVNAWGLAFNPNGPAWVSDNGTGLTTVYDPNGMLLLTVTVPTPAEGTPPSAPTGQVFNADANAFAGDRFILVSEDGTLSGWQPGFDGMAKLRVDNSGSGAVYKGVALARSGKSLRLFAADFRNAKVDVFESDYKAAASCNGGFVDDKLPPNYAPFNIFAAQDMLFVSYALQELPDKEDDDKGPGHGIVDLFDTDGNFLQRLLTGGVLNSPWGMALAPASFGHAPGRLLVGNFGDGHISVFKFELDGFKLAPVFEGFLGDAKGRALSIDGLWAIAFPPNAGGFDSRDLYFTAGPEDEQHGLFGRLEIAPPY
jgi:uncharacterized protein (TIGR03118 family)